VDHSFGYLCKENLITQNLKSAESLADVATNHDIDDYDLLRSFGEI